MDAPSTSSREDGQDLQPSVPSHTLPPWNPCHAWFKPYSRYSQIRTPQKSSPLRVIVNRPLVVRLTKDILETYQICNPSFTCCESVYVKRFLTNPSEAVLNDGFDNENSDLVLFVNLVLVNPKSGQRYVVKDMLGQGTFGQVVKCWHLETNSLVAVKIIKNQPAYYHQALVEVSILAALNQIDPEDKHHIVRMHDYFLHQNHLCISFEMLSVNLYDLIKLNHFKGISTNLIRVFSKQMLDALIVMKKASIIHCDLKPENVLLVSFQSGEIKIIDFGSACMENRTVYSYIQSRYYRSPEVLLGYQYTTAIDMWSFGCIIAELFLGLPLFPGLSEFDLIRRMQETLGLLVATQYPGQRVADAFPLSETDTLSFQMPDMLEASKMTSSPKTRKSKHLYGVRGQPPDYMLREAKNAHKFFKHVGRVHCLDGIDCVKGHQSAFQFLTEEEYEDKQLQKPIIGKQYFSHVKLEDIIAKYPYKKNLSAEEISQENRTRVVLLDFLRGLIHFDPVKRWTPSQAVLHPFITNEPFMRPYEPTPETPFIPVCQPLTVNHNPGSGHWFVAGLSPQVSNMNRGMPIKNSPYVQAVPFSYACSYGSVGSIGSHNDGIDLGSSFESYADSGLRSYYSTIGLPGLNTLTQGGGTILGSSPDARWRAPNASHGNELGVSPSYGNFRAMSLGASPSQFTPPGSQFSISAGSPSMYCPTSPRCGSHGSPLGKGAAISQYSRRRSLGQPGVMSMSPQECIISQHSMGNYNDGVNTEGKPRMHSFDNMHLSSTHPCLPHLRAGCGSLSASSSSSKEASSVSALHLHCIDYSSMQTAYDKPECSSSMPDPGDWDPNYSDDLLLEENSAEMNSLCSGVASGMLLSHSPGSSNSGAGIGGRFNRGVDQFHQPLNYTLANQRSNVPTQTYACMDGSTSLARGDTHFAYGRPVTRSSYHMSHGVPHSSPSQRGQQSFPRFNNPLQMAFVQDERMHSRGPYWNVGPHSPGKSAFANDSSWGQRSGHAVTIPPPRPRTKESARIS